MKRPTHLKRKPIKDNDILIVLTLLVAAIYEVIEVVIMVKFLS